MKKQPAFLEGVFKIEAFKPLPYADQQRLLLALMMVVILERARG